MKIPLNTPRKSSDVLGGYQPTPKERQDIAMRVNQFKLSGDAVFHTVQGEGNRIGIPTTFIRLQFCNLQCSFCDSWYTWRGDTPEYYREPSDCTVEGLLAKIFKAQEDKGLSEANGCASLTFTGGEPLVQQKMIEAFMHKYPEFVVQIETNGTIMPSDYLMERVFWNCSPKLGCSGNNVTRAFQRTVLEKISSSENQPCFKFVVCEPEDIDEVLKVYNFIPKHQIYIMPEGVTKEESAATYQKINAKLLSTGLNTSPRIQNIMFGAKRAA